MFLKKYSIRRILAGIVVGFTSAHAWSSNLEKPWKYLDYNLNPNINSHVSQPSLSADPRKKPFLAFSTMDRDTYQQETQILRWKKKKWTDVGMPIASVAGPSLGQDSQKRLYICTSAEYGKPGPRVWRWHKNQWQPVGGDVSDEAGYTSNRYTVDECGSISFDTSDSPIVSWSADVGAKADAVFVARWDKGKKRWIGLGDSSVGGRVTQVHLDIDHRDRPHIATYKPGGSYGGAPTSYFWRWKNGSWEQMGIDFPNSTDPTIAVYHNRVYVALTERFTNSIRVMRWRRGGWDELPSPGEGSASVLDFNLNGKLIMAYLAKDDETTTSIRVKILNNGIWHPVGDTLANYSEAQNTTSDLDIAVDAKGRPNVSWTERDHSNDINKVFVMRHSAVE